MTNFYKAKNGKYGLRSICKTCDIKKAQKWNIENKDKHSDHQKLYRESNRQATRDQRAKYAKSEKDLKCRSVWNMNNREYINKKSKEFRDRNPGYASFYVKMRKKQIKQATLIGLEDELKLIYLDCLRGKEVHHIVPLVENPNVCGLHVPWNLEYVTKEEHLEKHRKLRKSYV